MNESNWIGLDGRSHEVEVVGGVPVKRRVKEGE